VRVSTIIGGVTSAAALIVLATSPAHALTKQSVKSYTSSKGGYGEAKVTMTGSVYELVACDGGYADGYRAVAYLEKSSTGFYDSVHAASGSGVCVTEGYEWLPTPIRGTYTLTVCLRDGASGGDFNCRST
jgi:hypothetical protein